MSNQELVSSLVGSISITGLDSALKDINKFAEAMRTAGLTVSKEMGEAIKATKEVNQSFSSFSKAVSSELGKTNTVLKQHRKEVENLAKATKTQFSTADDSAKTHKKTIQEMVQSNAAQFRTAGRYLTAYGAVLTGIVAKAGKEFVKFQHESANVATMLVGTMEEVSGQMAVFNRGVKDLSIEFNQTTTTLNRALYDILSASVAPYEALNVLAVASEAATAGLTTVAVAANALTTVLNSYGMEASRAAEVSDKLWAVVKRGKVLYEELASNIGNVASVAATAGLSFDELAAVIATSTRSGVNYARAITGINALSLAFVKNTDQQREVARRFGFELSSMTLKSEGLIGVIQKLAGANEMNRRATAEEITAIFANRRALLALAPVLNNTAGYLFDVSLMANSAGLSSLAFSKVSQTLSFQLGQLGKTIKVLLIDYFEPLAPTVKMVVVVLQTLADALRNIPAPVQAAIAAMTALSGVLAAVAGAIALMAPGIIALIGVIGGPVVGTIAVVVAALVGAGGLVAALASVGEASSNAGEKILLHIDKVRQIKKSHDNQIKSINSLMQRYHELRSVLQDAQSTVYEQLQAEQELQSVIEDIIDIVPQAAKKWDQYGKVIEISTEKVNDFAKAQEELARIKAEIAVSEMVMDANRQREQWDRDEQDIQRLRERIEVGKGLIEELRAKRDEIVDTPPKKSFWDFLTGGELTEEKIDAHIKNVENSIEGYEKRIGELSISILQKTQAVKATAMELLRLEETGLITEDRMHSLFLLMPGLEEEFYKLKEAIEEVKNEQKQLIETMEDAREKYATWDEYHEWVLGKAAPATKTWTEQLGDLDEKIGEATASLKSMYEAEKDYTMEERLKAEEELIGLLNERLGISEKVTKEEEKQIKELSAEYRDAIKDLQEYYGMSNRAIIKEIEKRQKAYEKDTNEWKAWEKEKTEYTRKAAAEITAIWDRMRQNMLSGIKGGVADLISGDKELDKVFEDLGKKFASSMSTAFADYLITSLNVEDFLSSFEGIFLGAAFALSSDGAAQAEKILDNILDTFERLPEIVDGIIEALPDILIMLTEKVPLIIQALIDGVPSIIKSICDGIPIIISEFASSVVVIIASILESIPDIISAIIESIPYIISALISQTPALIQGIVSQLPRIIDAYIKLLPRVANALVKGISKAATSGVVDVYKSFSSVVSSIFKAFHIGKHGTTGIEEHKKALKKLEKGEMTGEDVIAQIRQYTTGRTGVMAWVDPEAKGAELEHLLTDSLEKRQEWFEKNLEQTGLFTELQLNEARDLLRLWEGDAEASAAKIREAYRVAYQDMGVSIWRELGLTREETGPWEDALSAAWDRAITGTMSFTDAFRLELSKLPDLTQENIEQMVKALSETGGDWEKLWKELGLEMELGDYTQVVDIEVETGKAKEELAAFRQDVQRALTGAKIPIRQFGEDLKGVFQQFLSGDLEDLRSALVAIPGMTEEMAEEFARQMRIIQQSGEELSFEEAAQRFIQSGSLGGQAMEDLATEASEAAKKAAESAEEFKSTFEGALKSLKIADHIDTESAKTKLYDAGYDAGKAYRDGFEEGASGSGILGGLLYDEVVFRDAFGALKSAGAKAGEFYRNGFAGSGILDMILSRSGMEAPAFAGGPGGAATGRSRGRLPEVIANVTGADRAIDNTAINQTFQISITLPPGSRSDDKNYWKRVAREHIIPATEEELNRKGKVLGVRR